MFDHRRPSRRLSLRRLILLTPDVSAVAQAGFQNHRRAAATLTLEVEPPAARQRDATRETPGPINATRPAELPALLRTVNATAISKPTQTATVHREAPETVR